MNFLSHPAFIGVDVDFLQVLQKTIDSSNGKSDLEMIGTIMAISNEAKRKNITFTPEMQGVLLNYLKSRLPANKRGQFDSFLAMFLAKMS